MNLHPFRALRPREGLASTVACLPYDVLTTAEARATGVASPDSFVHVIRPEIDLPTGIDPYAPEVYLQARDALAALVRRGALVRSSTPAIWIYRLDWQGRSQIGFVGTAEVEDYAAGRIKRHEFTRQVKEDDRARHVNTVSANTGPVFLTMHDPDGVDALQARLMAAAPTFSLLGANDVVHTLWAVDDPTDLAAIADCLASVDAFYIADGHHRAASALRTRDLRRQRKPKASESVPWERFLSVVFPASQLKILAYNRLVRDLNGHTPAELLAALEPAFEVGEPTAEREPSEARSFAMFLDNAWRVLRVRPHVIKESDPVARLDVALLQDHLLRPLLGIDDPRTDGRIRFIGGIRGTRHLERLVKNGEGAVAFSMYPTSIGELLDVADAGEVMPPKSTWFEPKLASGLVVHPLDS